MKNEKIHAFMLNDIINFNIDELVTHIEDNYPSADIYNIKRTYFHLQPNGNNLNNILSSFLVAKVNELNEGGEDVEKLINENINIFFDVTNKTDEIFIIERMTSN